MSKVEGNKIKNNPRYVWVSFYYRGGNGYHFQGSRGGNDTRLHCLALLNILKMSKVEGNKIKNNPRYSTVPSNADVYRFRL
jgi:hypothetical protein